MTTGASAAREFPQAAAANRHVFFNGDGSARSVREVYDWALKQPGGEETIRLTPVQPDTPRAFLLAATAQDSNIQMLLQGVMNWQPRGGFFGGGDDGASQGINGFGGALSFSPGLLNILSGSNES